MRYQNPYGITTTDAPYVNGDPSIGRAGSIPPAAAFEHPQREIVNTIIKAGLDPSDNDLMQLLKAIRLQTLNYAIDTGAVNAWVVTLDPALDQYTEGMPLKIKIGHTVTGPTTLNVNNDGNRNVVRANGSALEENDVVAGQVVEVVDDGTNYQITNYIGAGSGSVTTNTYNVSIPYAADTSITPNTITASYSPAITSLAAGNVILVKLANDITGTSAITCNAMSPVTLKRGDGSNTKRGDGFAGQVLLLKFDGTYFQIEGHASRYNIGDYVMSSTETPPAGTLECDGSAVSRTTYASLFAVIGTRFGIGNGSTTFNLPDWRGKFARSWAHGQATDPDRASRTNRGDGTTGDYVGTEQADQLEAHDHAGSVAHASQVEQPVYGNNYLGAVRFLNGAIGGTIIDLPVTFGSAGLGAETRPINKSMMMCIAY